MTAFTIGEASVARGSRATVDLPVSTLSNHTRMSLPVHVVHGESSGPVMFLSAAIHGDEILGVEIIRRLLAHPALGKLSGTLLAIPIVNSFGFLNHTRYMPDRRDLNRSFPGSDRGSLASLLADLFFREVVLRSQYGIDFHTAALHRTNLPQVRLAPDEPELLKMAEAFAPPVILMSKLREKSLRLRREAGVKVLLTRREALRFDEVAIDAGVKGALRVMAHLGWWTLSPGNRQVKPCFRIRAVGCGRLKVAYFTPCAAPAIGSASAKSSASLPIRWVPTRCRWSRRTTVSSSGAATCRSSIRATHCFTSPRRSHWRISRRNRRTKRRRRCWMKTRSFNSAQPASGADSNLQVQS
jgi:predicted deacylase